MKGTEEGKRKEMEGKERKKKGMGDLVMESVEETRRGKRRKGKERRERRANEEIMKEGDSEGGR